MKDIRKQLNSEVDIIRVENGAYRPFKKTLSAFLTRIVSSFTQLLKTYDSFLNKCISYIIIIMVIGINQ